MPFLLSCFYRFLSSGDTLQIKAQVPPSPLNLPVIHPRRQANSFVSRLFSVFVHPFQHYSIILSQNNSCLECCTILMFHRTLHLMFIFSTGGHFIVQLTSTKKQKVKKTDKLLYREPFTHRSKKNFDIATLLCYRYCCVSML